jgi:hypothetical protein
MPIWAGSGCAKDCLCADESEALVVTQKHWNSSLSPDLSETTLDEDRSSRRREDKLHEFSRQFLLLAI